jgi:O-antigen/teichoic acid export membrane protein
VWSRGAAERRAGHTPHSDSTNHLDYYYRSARVQAIVLGSLGAAGVVVVSWVATFFVDFSIDSFWALVALSAVVVFLTALATVFVTFLAGQQAARAGSRIEVGSAVMKVILTIVLVQSVGAVGAVGATVVALATLTALEYRLLLRRPDLLADRGADPLPAQHDT